MIFIPITKYIIKTKISALEINHLIESILEKRKNCEWWWKDRKQFKGNITGNNFILYPFVHYKNLSAPMIQGEIDPEINGCNIQLKLRPDDDEIIIQTLISVAIIIAIIIYLYDQIVYSRIQDINTITTFILLILLFICSYLLFYIGFVVQSNEYKKYFQKLFMEKRDLYKEYYTNN